jgi:hypothetical protein
MDAIADLSSWVDQFKRSARTNPKETAKSYARGAAGGAGDLVDLLLRGVAPAADPLNVGDKVRAAVGAEGLPTEKGGEVFGVPSPTSGAKMAMAGMLVPAKMLAKSGPGGGARVAKMLDLMRKGASKEEMWDAARGWLHPGPKAPGEKPFPLFHVNTEGLRLEVPRQPLPGAPVTGKAGDFVKDIPEVYAIEPELANIPTSLANDPNSGNIGWVLPGGKNGMPKEMEFNLAYQNDPDLFPGVIPHEFTHAVVGKEGGPSGGNAARFAASAQLAGQELPQIQSSLIRALLGAKQVEKFPPGAGRAGMLNPDQIQRMTQAAARTSLTDKQMELAMMLTRGEIGDRLAHSKFLSDHLPPATDRSYFNLDSGEGIARTAGLYAGKSPQWVKDHPPWSLSKEARIPFPEMMIDLNLFEPRELAKLLKATP